MFYLNDNKSYNDIKRGIVLPNEESEKLAELYGVITGDGYIGIYKDKGGRIDHYFLEISGNKTLDFDYLSNYVSNLFIELFNLKPTLVIKKKENTIGLRIGSKAIVCFFRDLGFPLGKKGSIDIPNWILENKRYMLNFLAGYFDTDGSVVLRRKTNGLYPSLAIGSKSEILLLQTKEFLGSLFDFPINFWREEANDKRGFKSVVYKLQINGPKRVILVTNLIKIHNRKHTDKIDKIVKFKS